MHLTVQLLELGKAVRDLEAGPQTIETLETLRIQPAVCVKSTKNCRCSSITTNQVQSLGGVEWVGKIGTESPSSTYRRAFPSQYIRVTTQS